MKLLLGVALISAAGSAQAATLTVPGDHPTLQAAADAAADGDEIRVGAGRHCGAVIRKRLTLTADGTGAATIVGCAEGPRLHGELRVGLYLEGRGGTSAASGTVISGLAFDGAGVSSGHLAALAFGVLGRFASDVVVSGNRFLGTVQAVTNTAGDRWTVTQNHISGLSVLDCHGVCGGGVGIVMQRATGALAAPGGSLNPVNRPDENTVADNQITGAAPAGFDAFMLAGVLVLAADRTVVFANRVGLQAPAMAPGDVAAAAVLIDNASAAGDEPPAVPGARATTVEQNDGRDTQHAVVIGGEPGQNSNGDELRLEGNLGSVLVEPPRRP
jgi:hypothetical protein